METGLVEEAMLAHTADGARVRPYVAGLGGQRQWLTQRRHPCGNWDPGSLGL